MNGEPAGKDTTVPISRDGKVPVKAMIRKPGDLPGSVELYSALDRGRSVTTGPLCTMASYEASPDLIQPRQSKSRGFLLPTFSASHDVACCGQGSAGSMGRGLHCGSGRPAGGAFRQLNLPKGGAA